MSIVVVRRSQLQINPSTGAPVQRLQQRRSSVDIRPPPSPSRESTPGATNSYQPPLNIYGRTRNIRGSLDNILSPPLSSSAPPPEQPAAAGTGLTETATWKPAHEPAGCVEEPKDYETNGTRVAQTYTPEAISQLVATSTSSDQPQVETSAPGFVPPPAPPPPPPPAPICSTNSYGGLGSALQSAQLRKSPKPDEEPGSGSLARSASPSVSDLQSCMMSEMARKLEERKRREREAAPTPPPTSTAAASSSTPSQLEPASYFERRASFDRGRSPTPLLQSSSGSTKPPALNTSTDSPKFPRSKRIQSLTGQEGSGSGGAAASSHSNYATSAELEAVKQELMNFVKCEISKAKQEIIDAVRLLLISKQQA